MNKVIIFLLLTMIIQLARSQTCSSSCPDSYLGDGICQESCNTNMCLYDYGDCDTLSQCASGCDSSALGDGYCDYYCNVIDCSFDYGDCDTSSQCNFGCDSSALGDGYCDQYCNVIDCAYDYGDCDTSSQCASGCSSSDLGDYYCDYECNVYSCAYDYGDCDTSSQCASGCSSLDQGDGYCDDYCNVQSCAYDYGDCDSSSYCECDYDQLGDGYCDSSCNIEECSYDYGDCVGSEFYGDNFWMIESQDNTDKAKKPITSNSIIGIVLLITFGTFSLVSTFMFHCKKDKYNLHYSSQNQVIPQNQQFVAQIVTQPNTAREISPQKTNKTDLNNFNSSSHTRENSNFTQQISPDQSYGNRNPQYAQNIQIETISSPQANFPQSNYNYNYGQGYQPVQGYSRGYQPQGYSQGVPVAEFSINTQKR